MSRVASTAVFIKLQPHASIRAVLDPHGKHVLMEHFLHGDGDVVRSHWLCKTNYSDLPMQAHVTTPIGTWNATVKLFTELGVD